MKKLFASVLCLVLLLSTWAHAEVIYDTWVLELVDIVISRGEQTIHLNPTISVHFGSDESCDHAWVESAVHLNGEELKALQIEYDSGVLLYSSDSAQDCVIIEEGDHMATLYSMMLGLDPGIDAKTAFSMLRTILKSSEAAGQFLSSISAEGFAAERLEEGAFGIHITAGEFDIQCKLQLSESDEKQKPFDFSGKNQVRYLAMNGITGSGDCVDALDRNMMQLMSDETVAEVLTLLGVGSSGLE